MKTRVPWHVVVFVAVCSTAFAQSKGPFAYVKSVLSVENGTDIGAAPGDSGELYFKSEGAKTDPPAKWEGEGPNFRSDSLLFNPNHGAWGQQNQIDVNAFSIGVDWITGDPITAIGVPPPTRWQALHFSVTPNTTGAAGSEINNEQATQGGAAADLFGYILPGSDGVAVKYIDTVTRAIDEEEAGLTPNPANQPNADGYDFFISEYLVPEPKRIQELPENPTYYFCVSAATVGNVPAGWWNGTPPSAATILSTTWNGNQWSLPAPFRRYDQIGLAQNDDVDALAIDRHRNGSTNNFLVSTTDTGDDPVLFGNFNAGAITLTPYLVNPPTGGPAQPVSTRLGLIGVDDVDAICSVDPGRGYIARHQTEITIGSFPYDLDGSMFRFFNPDDGADHLLMTVNGPPSPVGTVFAVPLFLFGAPLPTGLFLFDAPAMMQVPNGFDGDPIELDLTLPFGIPITDLVVQWAAVDTSTSAISLSPGMRLLSIGQPLVAPSASFTSTPATGAAPLTVTFTDTSTDTTGWYWDFDGDGVTDSYEQNPTHTFVTPGTYDVTLTAWNRSASDSTTTVAAVTVTPGVCGTGSTEHYGQGSPGIALDAVTPPLSGTGMLLRVNGPGSALGVVDFGSQVLSPLPTCPTTWIVGTGAPLGVLLSPSGTGLVTFSVPAGSCGLSVYFQAFITSGSSPCGLEFSDGLAVTFG